MLDKYIVNQLKGILIPTGVNYNLTKTLNYGEEVLWDGQNVTLSDGEKMRLPALQGAITQRWLVPASEFKKVDMPLLNSTSKYNVVKQQDSIIDLKSIQHLRKFSDTEEIRYDMAPSKVSIDVSNTSLDTLQAQKPPQRQKVARASREVDNSSYRQTSLEEEIQEILADWDKNRSVKKRVQEAVECYGNSPEIIEAICGFEVPLVAQKIREHLKSK